MNKVNSAFKTTPVHAAKGVLASKETKKGSPAMASVVKLVLLSRFITLFRAKTTFKFLK